MFCPVPVRRSTQTVLCLTVSSVMEEKGARPRACRLDVVPEERGEEGGAWLSRRWGGIW